MESMCARSDGSSPAGNDARQLVMILEMGDDLCPSLGNPILFGPRCSRMDDDELGLAGDFMRGISCRRWWSQMRRGRRGAVQIPLASDPDQGMRQVQIVIHRVALPDGRRDELVIGERTPPRFPHPFKRQAPAGNRDGGQQGGSIVPGEIHAGVEAFDKRRSENFAIELPSLEGDASFDPRNCRQQFPARIRDDQRDPSAGHPLAQRGERGRGEHEIADALELKGEDIE